MKKILAVDPGYGGTGWALFINDRYIKSDVIRISLIVRSKFDEEAVSKIMMYGFQDVIKETKPDKVIIETPSFWPSSKKSYTATAKGDLFKLIMLVGMFFAVCTFNNVECKTVKANIWKGQLSKKAVKNRLRRYLNLEFREHEADAVGLGLYELGRF